MIKTRINNLLNWNLFVIIIYLCFSCGVSERNDIYKHVPLGSKLSKEVLMKAQQIIPNKSELILLYDISTRWDEFNPHLLFYDSSLTLYAATFFPSDKVSSITNNKINALVFPARVSVKSSFRNDIPHKYQMYLNNRSSTISNGCNRADKIIERIKFKSNGSNIILFVRKSEDQTIGVGYRRSPATDSSFFKNFNTLDTLNFAACDLIFDFDNLVIKRQFIDDECFVREQMLVVNKSIFENFYADCLSNFSHL